MSNAPPDHGFVIAEQRTVSIEQTGSKGDLMVSVVVIDDDAKVRAFIRLVLEVKGCEVREASNGAEGMKAIRQRPADVVLCDIFMPEKEGLETIRELHKEFPQVKIVAMSGGSERLSSEDFLDFASSFGAVKVLYKPFSPKALAEVIREVSQP